MNFTEISSNGNLAEWPNSLSTENRWEDVFFSMKIQIILLQLPSNNLRIAFISSLSIADTILFWDIFKFASTLCAIHCLRHSFKDECNYSIEIHKSNVIRRTSNSTFDSRGKFRQRCIDSSQCTLECRQFNFIPKISRWNERNWRTAQKNTQSSSAFRLVRWKKPINSKMLFGSG